MSAISPFHQALHLIAEVEDNPLTLFRSTFKNSAARKVATEKVRTCQRYRERAYLNNSCSLMKIQPATQFPKLVTSLDYINAKIKNLFPNHLTITPLADRITNIVSNWSKLSNGKDIP